MDRRQFLKSGVGLGGMVLASQLIKASQGILGASPTAHVALVKTTDRTWGVNHAINLLGAEPFHGKDIFIKPNFNSADTPPGSTHNDTLAALIRKLNTMGAGPLTIGDRSGMGNTREVMEKKRAFTLAKELGARAVVLDELPSDNWDTIKQPDAHWQRGFALPRLVRSAGGIV